MRHVLVKIKPKIAALALVTGVLLSLMPPHVTDAADFSGHQPQKISVSRDSTQLDATAAFREAVYIKVEHEKFRMPRTQGGSQNNTVILQQAAVSFHGADGETAFLSCDIVSEQALFPGRRKDRSANRACDGGGNSRPQELHDGKTMTGIAMSNSLFPHNGERRYVSLEVSYI